MPDCPGHRLWYSVYSMPCHDQPGAVCGSEVLTLLSLHSYSKESCFLHGLYLGVFVHCVLCSFSISLEETGKRRRWAVYVYRPRIRDIYQLGEFCVPSSCHVCSLLEYFSCGTYARTKDTITILAKWFNGIQTWHKERPYLKSKKKKIVCHNTLIWTRSISAFFIFYDWH